MEAARLVTKTVTSRRGRRLMEGMAALFRHCNISAPWLPHALDLFHRTDGRLGLLAIKLLTTLARRNHGTFPTDRVRRIIAGDENHAAHGSREMPVWGPVFHQIKNDQDLGYVRLQNVMEYLISIQQK